MPKLSRSKRSYWPPPVYVARFAGGEVFRASIWSQEGKPLDFARGRAIACHSIAQERMRAADPAWNRIGPFAPPADDIEYGEMEWGGEELIDPFFLAQPRSASETKKPAVSPVEKLLAQIDKLNADDRATLLVKLL